MKQPKVTVVGAGAVGATTGQRIVEKGLADVVLIDIVEGLPHGKALDMMQSASIEGFERKITGSNDYADMAGSDLIVITAGIRRGPGMSRDDLLKTNAEIVGGAAENIKQHAPDSIVIVVSNPLDIMTEVALKATGFDSARVLGMAGMLDTARFSCFIAMEAGVGVQDVQSLVLGGHGDLMVPLPSHSTVGGVPLAHLLSGEKIAELVERTQNGGAEIVGLMKTASAFYAPSAAVSAMVGSILNDQKRILPSCCRLDGQYGLSGMYLGVPAQLGRGGVEKIIELELTDDEMAGLRQSAKKVRQGCENLEKLRTTPHKHEDFVGFILDTRSAVV